jgi:polyisoprenoid-binding protein YceI
MKALITLSTIFISSFLSFGQWTVDNAKSTMTIDGTSNVHDWTENVETINGSLTATLSGNALSEIASFTMSIPVSSIKSGKSGMDKNTYTALKSDKHPNIKFNLQSTKIAGNDITVTGTLEIAGTKKTVTFPVKYSVTGGNPGISGSYKMKMTDFNVEPPTALFGTISTGNDVTIKFNIQFKK